MGCVTVKFCIIERTIVHWSFALFYFLNLVSLRSCLHLITKLLCKFTISVETLVLWKLCYFENCVTVKSCVIWKLRCFEELLYSKLCCFEKLCYLKTVLLLKKLSYLKIVLLLKKLRYLKIDLVVTVLIIDTV